MPLFHCRIGTADGKILEKTIQAKNKSDAEKTIFRDGSYIFEIKKASTFFSYIFYEKLSSKGISDRDFRTFNHELLALLKAGIPIVKCLDTLIEKNENRFFLEVLSNIRKDIKEGLSISDAFSKYPQIFSDLYVSTIRSGEKTGNLVANISKFIEYLKRTEKVKSEFKQAMIYPLILICLTFFALIFLLGYVVPNFTRVYLDTQVKLPFPTVMLIQTANLFKKYFVVFLGLFVVTALFLKWFLKTERGRDYLDRAKLAIPVLGEIIYKYSLAKMCRSLSTVLKGGIPLVNSLKMVKDILNNNLLEGRLERAIKRVEEGESLSISLEKVKLMPNLAIRMINVGESSGALEDILSDISDFYEDEVSRKLDLFVSLFEPVFIIIMGLVICAVVVSIYLPIFKLAGTIR
ncbi:MAG: type II secretion system F family protein [Thermodesulfobacteriota bacterium]|nr:type II secretion system F family protein [Thermodesulfobacteriota bacterium]